MPRRSGAAAPTAIRAPLRAPRPQQLEAPAPASPGARVPRQRHADRSPGEQTREPGRDRPGRPDANPAAATSKGGGGRAEPGQRGNRCNLGRRAPTERVRTGTKWAMAPKFRATRRQRPVGGRQPADCRRQNRIRLAARGPAGEGRREQHSIAPCRSPHRSRAADISLGHVEIMTIAPGSRWR